MGRLGVWRTMKGCEREVYERSESKIMGRG